MGNIDKAREVLKGALEKDKVGFNGQSVVECEGKLIERQMNRISYFCLGTQGNAIF